MTDRRRSAAGSQNTACPHSTGQYSGVTAFSGEPCGRCPLRMPHPPGPGSSPKFAGGRCRGEAPGPSIPASPPGAGGETTPGCLPDLVRTRNLVLEIFTNIIKIALFFAVPAGSPLSRKGVPHPGAVPYKYLSSRSFPPLRMHGTITRDPMVGRLY